MPVISNTFMPIYTPGRRRAFSEREALLQVAYVRADKARARTRIAADIDRARQNATLKKKTAAT